MMNILSMINKIMAKIKFPCARDKNGNDLPNVPDPDITMYIQKKNEDLIEIKCETFDELFDIVPKNSNVRWFYRPIFKYIDGKFGVSTKIVQVIFVENDE